MTKTGLTDFLSRSSIVRTVVYIPPLVHHRMRIARDLYDERHMLLLIIPFELGVGEVRRFAQEGEDVDSHVSDRRLSQRRNVLGTCLRSYI